MKKPSVSILAICSLVAFSPTSDAGEFFANFDTGTPPRCRLSGDAMVNPGAGVNDSGMLRLTPPDRERQGSFVVENFDGNDKIVGFVADFKMLIGGGGSRGADGLSFSYARKIPGAIGEAGAVSGIVVVFDTYKSAGGPPEVVVKYNNNVLETVAVEKLRTGETFVDVQIKLDASKVLSVTYDGKILVECDIPGYQPVAGVEFGFGARTGGMFDSHLIDELNIVTTVEDASSSAKK